MARGRHGRRPRREPEELVDDEREVLERLRTRAKQTDEHMSAQPGDDKRLRRFVVYELEIPLFIGSEFRDKVTVRYPTGADLKWAEKLALKGPVDELNWNRTNELIKRLTGLNQYTLDEMAAVDIAEITEIIEDFQTRPPRPEPESPPSSS